MTNTIITIASLIVSITAIVANTLIVRFQINKTQQFDREKLSLDLFADYLALSIKRTLQPLYADETAEYERLNAKLALIADDDLREHTLLLYESITNEPHSENTLNIIQKERELMRERLSNFSSQHRHH